MSTTSSTTNTYFTGQSTFSADLNNVISRSVAIATLPMTLLQNQQSDLTNQQAEVQTLGTDFMSVQSAVDQLNSSMSASSYSASVDVPAVATASVSSGALPGTYALNVTNLGSQTNAISAAASTAVTNPSSQNISSASAFTLTVNGKNYTLSPTGQNLNALVQSINSSGAAVQATVVNVGGSANPDYRLSIQSTQYSPDTIQLNDGSNDLLSTLNTGSYVQYQVNGQPSTPINSTSRTLSISTGLTATVAQTGSANITVAQSSSSVVNALSAFVSAYNTAADELTKNRGQNGGALAGNSLIRELQSSLSSLVSYNASSTGSVNSLADLGITVDSNGHLQFDQSVFNSASSSSPQDVSNFLGGETSGGFLQTAYSTLTSLTDSVSGSISAAGESIGTSIQNLTTEISAKQTQITQLQTTLTSQMAQADAALASIQGQVTEMTNLFAAQMQASKNITG